MKTKTKERLPYNYFELAACTTVVHLHKSKGEASNARPFFLGVKCSLREEIKNRNLHVGKRTGKQYGEH